jgi:hypothetical protein
MKEGGKGGARRREGGYLFYLDTSTSIGLVYFTRRNLPAKSKILHFY